MNRRTLIRALVRVRRLSTGTSAALGEAPIAGNKLPDFTALRTNIPTIFTCTPLDPVVHLDYITARCNVLFKQPARYVAPKELGYELPRDGLPEFAFVGRSNVGKSTLIAELLGNRGLVKVSKTPGCTQNVNYYCFDSKGKGKLTYLVDLPGYGYASASKTNRAKWADIMKNFLKGRDFSVMRRVYVLVDSRRGVLDVDEDMMSMLNNAGLPYQIILTKTDCISNRELYVAITSAFNSMKQRKRNGCFPLVHTISSRTGSGIQDLKRDIARVIYREYERTADTDAVEEEGSENK